MTTDNFKPGFNRLETEDFRAQQQEMLNLSQEYSRARLAAWNGEVQQMQESWASFSREWQSSLEEMSSLAQASFEDLAARGEAAGSSLSQSIRKALGEISGEVEDWGDNFLRTLEKVGQSWSGVFGGSGVGNLGRVVSEGIAFHGRANSVVLTLPPLGVAMFTPEELPPHCASLARMCSSSCGKCSRTQNSRYTPSARTGSMHELVPVCCTILAPLAA